MLLLWQKRKWQHNKTSKWNRHRTSVGLRNVRCACETEIASIVSFTLTIVIYLTHYKSCPLSCSHFGEFRKKKLRMQFTFLIEKPNMWKIITRKLMANLMGPPFFPHLLRFCPINLMSEYHKIIWTMLKMRESSTCQHNFFVKELSTTYQTTGF